MAIDLSALSDVEMFSNSDRDAGSKSDVNSKLAVALSQRKAMKRAQLFLRGEFGELLRSMHSEDKRYTCSPQTLWVSDLSYRIMSTWLYQYWRFSHRTAKGWGRPSANWAPGLLALNIDKDKDNNSPISSRVIEDLDVPLSESTSFRTGPPEAMPVPTASNPTALCYWTVHKWFTGTEYDVTDAAPQFREILITALESGDFSDIRSTSLPVALPQVLKSAERTPNALSRECLGFAVMGRDEDLVKSCLLDEELDADDLIPLYLAISYLDGARTCCNILGPIVSSIFSKNELSGETGHTNDLGHTFLDSLMIEILSSHTSLKTKEIDSSWDQDTRFTGQEVDICGRWDADSDCILALYAQGRTAIPFSWKHKFCHTSAQAICHCISTFHELAPCGDINTVSGLFLKHCSYCGLKMKLYPLHTLVVTAFFLVQRGCEDEDLFGILAYLLSMLSTDVNPLWTAEVSLAALQINDDTGQCDHEHLDALCFAKKIESIYSNTWTEETSTSWHIFCYVLNSSIHEWTEVAKISLCNHCRSESDCDFYNKTSEFDIFDVCSKEVLWELEDFPWAAFECDGENCQSVNFFSGNKTLGTLLAAVQIELLTYRRQKDGDPWTSGNFNMQDLLESLETRNEVGVKLVQDQMMKPFCKCGTFRRGMPECPRAADACAFHFSNLEDPGCEKVTYVDMPRR